MELNSISEMELIGDDDVKENAVSNYTQDYKLCDSNTLENTLKPLFLSMRIMGSIYGDAFQAGSTKCNSVGCSNENLDRKVEHQAINTNHHRKSCIHNLGFCYIVFVLAVHLILIGHGIYEIYSASSTMEIMRMTFRFSFAVLCGSQYIVCIFIISCRTKKNSLNRFDKFVKAMLQVRAESVVKTKHRVIRNVKYGWIYMAIYALVFWIGSSLKDPDLLEIFLGGSDFSRTHSDQLIYPFKAMVPPLVGSWAIPTCFYISMCNVVVGCFDDLFERASSSVLEKKHKIDLKSLRREYLNLCEVLSALNDLLSPLGMVIFSIYLPLICLNINVGIETFKQDHSVINKVAYASWMVLNSSLLFLISMNGARVNESVSDTDVMES